MIVSIASIEYAFYWSDGGGTPPQSMFAKAFDQVELGFGSVQQVLLFLRRFSDLHGFRTLLSLRYPGQINKWRLDEIFAKLAAELVRKRLRVVKRWVPAPAAPVSTDRATIVPRRQQVEFPEAPTEPPTFLSNHNPDAQAEALAGAASEAEPFCEECEKARLSPRSFTGVPEVEPATFSDDNDTDAQAEALIAAGIAGTPFCEECEKLKKAAEEQKLTFVEICLIDGEGKPVPNIPYRLIDTKNQEHNGELDAMGKARVDGIPPGSCKVSFPSLDQDAWSPA